MTDTELFFALLRVAVGTADALPQVPTADEWRGMMEQASRQALMGVAFTGVERLPAEQRPPRQMVIAWYATTEKIAEMNRRLDRDSVWVSEQFAKRGMRNAVLKGQGNAQLYPNPLRRQPGDVDIWLDGRRTDIIEYVRCRFPDEPITWMEVNFPVRPGTIIEVHTTPSMMSCPTDNARMQRYFHRHRDEIFNNRIDLPGGQISAPTWRVNAVFQLSHIYRHLLCEGVGLRQVTDYHYLLCAGGDRAAAMADVRSMHMQHFAAALMWVLRQVLHTPYDLLLCQPDANAGRHLLDEIMLAGNFGKYDPRAVRGRSRWGNFWTKTFRNLRFLRFYPREVLWNPWFRLHQHIWLKRHGYR